MKDNPIFPPVRVFAPIASEARASKINDSGEDELAESARAGYANAVSASSAPPLIERENARAPP